MTLKQERMADRIREILSGLLLLEVTDPALQGVTITEVTLDREIEYADIYVNALGDEGRRDEVMAGLKRAQGFLRRELSKRIQLRRTPNLNFHWDITLSRGQAMEQVLDRIKPTTPPTSPVENNTEDGNQDT